jgi:hypothetical protein
VSDVATDAVIVEPFKPNETLLLSEKVMAESAAELVPAEKDTAVGIPAMEAVMVEPFRPNETPLLFDRTKFDRFCDVVPAETLMFVSTPTGGVVLPVPVTVPSGGQ